MSDRPIIFSGEMVRAILEGRKTQTRRVIKPQPYKDVVSLRQVSPSGVEAQPSEWISWTERGDISQHVNFSWHSPYGQPGDHLWVRETFCIVDDRDYGEERWVDYRATPKYAESHPAGWDNAPDDAEALKWRPSIHMQRWASRITLEVVRVDVERVQEISDDDAIEEGVDRTNTSIPGYARQRFHALWDSINAKRGFGWDSNPWVWVVEFKVAHANG